MPGTREALSCRRRAVVVVRLVVHHQLPIDKVEAVGPRLPRARDDSSLDRGVELRHGVDDLPSVGRVWDNERQREVEALDEDISEVVPLDHPEVVQRLVSDGELQGGADGLKVQKGRAKVVADRAHAVVCAIVRQGVVARLLGNLEENLLPPVLDRPDLERREVDLVNVRTQGAQEAVGGGPERVHLLWRYVHRGRR
eukprot:CAMPEP_0171171540 /NCGR_PEP_ID=MMETSP0790-20130122/9268_1 /TAXON_ID=2925 /ORGANISM="Alexandrium catenella, Strain OF101" /LENGTH=196 /DNA_ID=CAMNT_0011636393 /DNA_START=46 /DNA_END=633 /DNA_ORIENTATION=+